MINLPEFEGRVIEICPLIPAMKLLLLFAILTVANGKPWRERLSAIVVFKTDCPYSPETISKQ